MQVADFADKTTEALTEGFERLLGEMAALGDRRFVDLADRCEQRLAGARLAAVARLAGSTGDVRTDRRRARSFLPDGRGRSRRSVSRDARRAALLAANPALADQAADGGLAGDGVDALARAADESTGVVPDAVLGAVAGIEPDQAARVVEEFLDARATAEEANEKWAAQMEARRVRRYTVPASGGEPALAGIGIEGPDAVIDRIWAGIDQAADAAYREAGGRDRVATEHVPLNHRRFDAAVNRLDGSGGDSRGGSRPAVVVTVDVEDLRPGAAERGSGIQVGSGPISDDLLADYASAGDLSVLLRLAGQPLWLGRARRLASAAQFLALVIRDRGCVLCGAAHQRCQAHHLTPWHAPAKGRTDLDQLALLCGPCHRRLHDADQTLYRQRVPNGSMVWATRPATPEEREPCHRPRPERIQRE